MFTWFLAYRLTMKNDYPDHPKRWDILILTQFWPATSCYSWKRLNASHKCFFPSQKNKWAINGLWLVKVYKNKIISERFNFFIINK